MLKKILAIFVIFSASILFADGSVDESMVSVNRWMQTSDIFEDYLIQTQTKAILDPAINGILYPVIGFPAIVTPDEPCFSIIFRYNGNKPFEYVKIIRLDDSGRTEFLNISRYSFNYSNPNFNYLEKIGENIVKLSVCTNILLPEAKYDIALKMTDGEEMISRNALFFPHYEESDPAKFLIVADPQIEDLLSKKTDDMNFNPENYPFYAENSLLNYDQQFGIIKATFSQLNSADTNFSIMLGDIAYGRNYQQEYSDFYDLMTNLEVPMFSIPGNHDGYAQFTVVDDLNSPLESDGLEYWSRFLGPRNNAFRFRNKTYLLLNTYDGTSQRRASNQIGIGDTGASPVANWGGYLAERTLNWAEKMLENNDVAAVFGHMTPLGQDATGKYHANRAFSKIYGIISVIDDQEWNIDSSSWDSDVFDGVFNETQTANNGVSLTSFLAKKENPPIYFSGHTHHDRVFTFEKGTELIPDTGVIAPEKMEFIMTTTMATEGSGDYWGFRRVSMSDDEVSYNYSCERYENCGIDSSLRGMQSIPSGNLWVTYTWQKGSDDTESIFRGGDGLAPKVTAEIVNYLPTEEDVTLRFIMPAAQYGYKLDNENFKIVDAAASSDLSKVILIVKGKVAAGSTFDAFYNRNFTKTTDYVTVSPLGEGENPFPEVEYTDIVPAGNPSTGKVLNADKFSSLIWSVKVLGYPDELYDFASGSSFEYYGAPSDFYLRYTTLTGVSGTVQLPVYYYEEDEEPEDSDVVVDDDDVVSDDDLVPADETDTDDEDTDEPEPAKKKSKGCSITVF